MKSSRNKYFSKNLIKRPNAWIISIILKMHKELTQKDEQKNKMITMHMALYTRDDIDNMYQENKGGWEPVCV